MVSYDQIPKYLVLKYLNPLFPSALPTLQEEGTATTTTVVEGSSVEVQCPVRNGYTVKWYKVNITFVQY